MPPIRRITPRLVAAVSATTVIAAAAVTLAAGPAHAAGADCTFTDTTHSATADSVSNPVLNVTDADSVSVSCTGLPASTLVATSIATGGASLVSGLANQEAFADISKAVLQVTGADGTLSTPYTVWSETLTNGSSCAPTQAATNAGLTCTLAVASTAGVSLGAVQLVYSGQPTPVAPTLTTDKASYAPGATVTLAGSGFYGAPITGTPNAGASVTAPTLSLDGTTVSNALTTSAATWPDSSSDSLTPGGVLGGALTVALSSTISAGTHTLAVTQPDASAYPGPAGSPTGTVQKSVTFIVAKAAPPAPKVVATKTTASVKKGHVVGKVTAAGKGVSGLTAALDIKSGAKWKKVATLKTHSGGAFTSAKLKKSGSYKVVTAKQAHGGKTYGTSTSKTVKVKKA